MIVVTNRVFLNEDAWDVKESTSEYVIEQLRQAAHVRTTLEDDFYAKWLSKKLSVDFISNQGEILGDPLLEDGAFLIEYTYTSLKKKGTKGIKFYRLIPKIEC